MNTIDRGREAWTGKRVLITGGTSGLGRALALEAEARGARVVIVARSKGPLEALTRGRSLHGISGDVSSKRDTYKIAGEAIAHLGGVDVLIHCASWLGATPLRPLLDTDCEDLARALETNLVGPFRLTKAILPGMVLSRSGWVVTISSDAAVNAYPSWGGYGISKAATDHLTRIWNEELKEEGVRFIALDPGDMDTPMHQAALPEADPTSLYRPEEVARDLLNFLGRSGANTPELSAQVRFTAEEWRRAL